MNKHTQQHRKTLFGCSCRSLCWRLSLLRDESVAEGMRSKVSRTARLNGDDNGEGGTRIVEEKHREVQQLNWNTNEELTL